ncbi:MAG: VOC family protein, partial [Candidatus Nanopelagicales bacterium]
MGLSLGMITTDSTDPLPLARWWAERFSGQVIDEGGGWFVRVQIPGAMLAFQKVLDPTPGKNKIHVDLTTDDDLDATAQELLSAGASLVGERSMDGFRWFTLADPQGNQFCLARG